ncbi:larval/pupal cuticle protein H1C-like [Vanessa cardui]|uniref:larval/pupal cuticle protein H1C-like n=1 Tax=Vanessa cardui TaxID=171605 RepID=UPI001F13345D|nr:larval/pupal cuticle protein H1C-like [Vanessa cardui]
MFKFAVLCAFLAAATAEPSAIISNLGYSANIVAPATTVVSSYPNNLFYSAPYYSSAPLAYSTPLGYSHLIKKRSAPLAVSSYTAPSPYFVSTPLATSYASPLAASYAINTPLTTTYTAAGPLASSYITPYYATAAHLIKKRSAPFFAPSTYVAPYASYSAATPFVPTTYAVGSPYVSTPLITATPFGYNAHLIKKRSAPLAVSAYSAPAAFSHQSRFDYRSDSPAITYSSYSPFPYSSPIAVPHVF